MKSYFTKLMMICLFLNAYAFGVEKEYELKGFGAWWSRFYYPKDLDGLDENSIVYCVGCSDDISHDVVISGQLGCEIHLFDPTPDAKVHYDLLVGVLQGTRSPSEYTMSAERARIFQTTNKMLSWNHFEKGYWSMVINAGANTKNFHFYDVGVFTEDNPSIPFYFNLPCSGYLDRETCHKTFHGLERQSIQISVKKISTIMKELGHERIDLLKLDIEGVECDVIDQMLDEGIFPKYLSVDFDLGWNVASKSIDKERCFSVMNRLKKVGYKLLHSGGSDYSYIYVGNET